MKTFTALSSATNSISLKLHPGLIYFLKQKINLTRINSFCLIPNDLKILEKLSLEIKLAFKDFYDSFIWIINQLKAGYFVAILDH